MNYYTDLFDDAFQKLVKLPESEDSRRLEIHYIRSDMCGEPHQEAFDFYKIIKDEILFFYDELKCSLTEINESILPNETWKGNLKGYIYAFDKNLKTYFQSSPDFLLPTEILKKALECLLNSLKEESGNSVYIKLKFNLFSQLIKLIDDLLIKLRKYSENEKLLSIYND